MFSRRNSFHFRYTFLDNLDLSYTLNINMYQRKLYNFFKHNSQVHKFVDVKQTVKQQTIKLKKQISKIYHLTCSLYVLFPQFLYGCLSRSNAHLERHRFQYKTEHVQSGIRRYKWLAFWRLYSEALQEAGSEKKEAFSGKNLANAFTSSVAERHQAK